MRQKQVRTLILNVPLGVGLLCTVSDDGPVTMKQFCKLECSIKQIGKVLTNPPVHVLIPIVHYLKLKLREQMIKCTDHLKVVPGH